MLFKPLRLGKGRRILGVASIASKKSRCSASSEDRTAPQAGIKGDFLFVYHVQQFGDKVGQADIALDIDLLLHARFFANNFGCS